MKKLSLLIIVAILASTLMAAALPGKLLRLTVINKSGYPVYIKLEGQIFGQFYYLTIPDGETMDFTIMADTYKRTTWACDGVQSSGSLIMTQQIRLTFTQCNKFALKWAWTYRFPFGWGWYRVPNGGEPTMEKVVYFKYLTTAKIPWFVWDPFWVKCGWWMLSLKTFKTPVGCAFHYQY